MPSTNSNSACLLAPRNPTCLARLPYRLTKNLPGASPILQAKGWRQRAAGVAGKKKNEHGSQPGSLGQREAYLPHLHIWRAENVAGGAYQKIFLLARNDSTIFHTYILLPPFSSPPSLPLLLCAP